MKNSFFSRFTPKEPKFFPLLKQLSEILVASSELLVESLKHDSPEERAGYYKQIKDMEREGDKLTHLILDELGTTFITPFDREDIHDLASSIDDVIDGINSCAKRITIYNPRLISESGKELSRMIRQEADILSKRWMSLRLFVRIRIPCVGIAQRCTISRIKQMIFMNSLLPNFLRKRKTVLNSSRLKKLYTNWKRPLMRQSMWARY